MKKKRVAQSLILFSLFIFHFSFLLSCASAPRVTLPAVGNEFTLLPEGGNVYLWVNAEEGRPLLDLFSPIDLNNRDVAQVIDRTDRLVAALYPGNGERRFFLAATGNFPQSRANFSFALNRDWRRQNSPSGGSYWYFRPEDIAIAINPDLVRVSDADPIAHFTAQSPPRGFIEFQEGLALAGWMPSSMEFINSFLSNLGVPLQIPAEDFFFGAAQPFTDPEDADYWELVFRIRTPSETHARSLVTLFSVARLFVMSGMVPSEGFIGGTSINPREFASLLFAYLPELNGDFLTIRSNHITIAQMALLFGMFPVYSN